MENPPVDPEFTRAPYLRDLIEICRGLNAAGARYVVMGGMAINAHGNIRATEDIDLLIETTEENERKVLEVLALLPEGVATEIKPGEVSDYVVVRICDEFTVDLMAKACGTATAAPAGGSERNGSPCPRHPVCGCEAKGEIGRAYARHRWRHARRTPFSTTCKRRARIWWSRHRGTEGAWGGGGDLG